MTDPVFRNSGVWGAGLARRLTSLEVDGNFWSLLARVVLLEATPDAPAGIGSFEIVGSTFFVHLTDGTILGPYILPVATLRSRGPWSPTTNYSLLDTVTVNGGLYLVIFAHTSGATFDAGANDGSGHDYYSLMIQMPDGVIPLGGATGMVLTKATSGDLSLAWDWKLPLDPVEGRYIRANSSTPDDASWVHIPASDVGYTPSTGSGLTSSNVQDALDEVGVDVSEALADANRDASLIEYTPGTGSGLTDTNVGDALDTLGARDTLGKQTVWVPSSSMTPRLINGPSQGIFESITQHNLYKTLDFDKDTVETAQFDIVMPKSWDGHPVSAVFYWSHPSTGFNFNVVWKLEIFPVVPNTDTFDSVFSGFDSLTDTGGTTDVLYASGEVDVTTGATGGDLLVCRVSRTADDVGDTLDVDARLHGVALFYVTDKYSDT